MGISYVFFYSSGFILTYFALDWGLWAIVFTIAVSQSLGYGLAYAPTVGATLKVKLVVVLYVKKFIINYNDKIINMNSSIFFVVVSQFRSRLVCVGGSGRIRLRLGPLGSVADGLGQPG
jgi:hypothetical protein